MPPRKEPTRQADQTYFITFATAQRRPFFRQEPWALMLVNILERYLHEYELHDFVLMPDHIHLLLSPHGTVERSVQLIKGGFSFQAKRAFAWKLDIWQPGFSDHRVRDHDDYFTHVACIRKNAASLREGARIFDGEQCSLPLSEEPQWLKPPS